MLIINDNHAHRLLRWVRSKAVQGQDQSRYSHPFTGKRQCVRRAKFLLAREQWVQPVVDFAIR